MNLEEFKNLALRTESKIDQVQLNTPQLITLLEMTVALTEILDGIKKLVFYNKEKKLTDVLDVNLSGLKICAEKLLYLSYCNNPVGTFRNDCGDIPENLNPRVFHGILGMITESGELAQALLNILKNPEETLDPVNIQEEMSDTAWYQAILHDELNLNWEQGLINVIEKLRVRYPDKFTEENAENRDLKAEREVLERT